MLATVHSFALIGIDSIPVRVEVDLASYAFPTLVLVGLPDAAVRESRERIVSALRNQGFKFPDKKITVNLAPAGLPKGGVGFDLPIAIGLLAASGQAPAQHLAEFVWTGELSLDGRIQPVRGALSMGLAEKTRRGSARVLILPKGNGPEAAVAGGVKVGEVGSLKEVVRVLFDGPECVAICREDAWESAEHGAPLNADMADVRGQFAARRGLEVAAAGGHNILFIGSPGTGKSLLAERLAGILPPMTRQEQLEATVVQSAAGLLPPGSGLVTIRPFRAPHHSITEMGLIGGGRPPLPGEISLAHRGVLFLDELPEFRRHVLEGLRQPLESGTVTITRVAATVRFPCRFQFVAAMNPCPCGRRLDRRGGCRCTPRAVERYLGRISGPLLDRIDIQLEMAPVTFAEMSLLQPAEDSMAVRSRVREAWERQQSRFRADPRILFNAQMGLQETRSHCRLQKKPLGMLRTAVARLGMSPRAFHRVLRLSRTIADLAGSDEITETHVAEAIGYRLLDRRVGSPAG